MCEEKKMVQTTLEEMTKESISSGGKVMFLRTGELPDIETKQGVSYSGTLESVVDFAKKRVFEEQEAHLEINYSAGTATLVTREQYKNGITVKGSLIQGSALSRFRVNTGDAFSLESFAKLVRQNRLYFKDQDNSTLLKSIEKFNASRRIQLKNENDRRGNVNASLVAECQQTIQESFVLTIPIFEGYPKTDVKVDVFTKVTDNGVSIELESVDLTEQVELKKENLLKDVRTRVLAVKKDIVIIEK
ncbi:hypothetical protein J6Z39_09060 [bacterium]|nr:hypothetical protein [bacterium]MBP5435952.1 hypothetical protein [bacterium]